jgi:hypothetical protein
LADRLECTLRRSAEVPGIACATNCLQYAEHGECSMLGTNRSF